MSLEALQSAAHKAGIENENAWLDLQHAEKTVVVMRQKYLLAALANLRAQMALEAAQEKLANAH